jgi:uncharacterized protein (DUF362 family)
METEESKNKVAVVKYDGTSSSVAKALELCDGLDVLKPGAKVLLKPNILWGGTKNFPPYGRVTTSTMVEYVLQTLRDRGCTDITIGEGTIPNKEMDSSTARGFDWTGIGKVANRYGARLVDFNSEPCEDLQLEDVKVKVSKLAMECDFLIDIPVLKAHRQTKVSLGMKNLKGCLALNSKKAFHRYDLNRLIALLNMKVRPSLTIIDGIYGLEKGPEFLGTPHRMDLIIAGKDVFSCDIVGAAVMGINPAEVDHFREYASLTGRTVSLERIEVKGEQIDQVARKFEWSLSFEEVFRQYGIEGLTIQEPGNSFCSGCSAILSALTGVLTKDCPGQAFDGVEICAGREIRAKAESRKVLLLGDCAVSANRELKDALRIKGCPAPILDTVMTVALKCLPPQKAAMILLPRTFKNIGTKLGVYHEAFPAFGLCGAPEFDRKHF